MKLLIALLSAVILLSCSHNTTVFEQTCITCIKSQRLSCTGSECPATFMIDTNSVVTIVETGENLYVNGILRGEGMKPEKGVQVAIAKLKGRYFLTGEDFANVWIITPEEKNIAGYEPVQLPAQRIKSPVFELYENRLLVSGSNLDGKYLLNEDKNKWEIFKNSPSKGE